MRRQASRPSGLAVPPLEQARLGTCCCAAETEAGGCAIASSSSTLEAKPLHDSLGHLAEHTSSELSDLPPDVEIGVDLDERPVHLFGEHRHDVRTGVTGTVFFASLGPDGQHAPLLVSLKNCDAPRVGDARELP